MKERVLWGQREHEPGFSFLAEPEEMAESQRKMAPWSILAAQKMGPISQVLH